MICELHYTSAQRGLYPGASGYCTVKATPKLPPRLRELLESLSNYRAVFPPGDARASRNPVGVSYLVAQVGGTRWSILSRISPAPLDYSKRSNFFAHHLVFSGSDHGEIDPAWMASHPDLLQSGWDGRVEEITDKNGLPRGKEISRVCDRWQAITGDAGWAGVAAQKLQDREIVYIAYEIGSPVLPLIAEVYSLLRPEVRASTTFSTYYCGLAAGLDCQLRAVVAGSPEHEAAKRTSACVIELRNCGSVTAISPLVTRARTGKVEEIATDAAPKSPQIGASSDEPAEYALASLPLGSAQKHRYFSTPQRGKISTPLAHLGGEAPVSERGGLPWGMALMGLVIGILVGALSIVPFWLREKGALQARPVEVEKSRDTVSPDTQKHSTEIVGLQSMVKSHGETIKKRDEEARKAKKSSNEVIDGQNEKIAKLDKEVLGLKKEIKTSDAENERIAKEKKVEVEKVTKERDAANDDKADAKRKADQRIANLTSKTNTALAERDQARASKMRLSRLPDAFASKSELKVLGEVDRKGIELKLEGGPKNVELKKVEGQQKWLLVVTSGDNVTYEFGEFLIPPKSQELSFRWTPPPENNQKLLLNLWIELSFARVIASNDKGKTKEIDLFVEKPEPAKE